MLSEEIFEAMPLKSGRIQDLPLYPQISIVVLELLARQITPKMELNLYNSEKKSNVSRFETD